MTPSPFVFSHDNLRQYQGFQGWGDNGVLSRNLRGSGHGSSAEFRFSFGGNLICWRTTVLVFSSRVHYLRLRWRLAIVRYGFVVRMGLHGHQGQGLFHKSSRLG